MKIIGILSIKGGAGKTTLVTNLANILANSFNKKVLVVDANFSAPNLRIHLGLEEPKLGIHDVLQGKADLYETIYETPYNFDIIPSKLTNKNSTKVSELMHYLDEIKHHYDFILIDSSPNMNAEIRATISSSDILFIVSTPDLASISCVLNTKKIANDLNKKIEGLIANKIYGISGELTPKEVEKVTGLKVIGALPHNLSIHESTLKRVPLKINARTKYCREFLEISKLILLLNNPNEDVGLEGGILFKSKIEKNRKNLFKLFGKRRR